MGVSFQEKDEAAEYCQRRDTAGELFLKKNNEEQWIGD
jgi:hypothetical protein